MYVLRNGVAFSRPPKENLRASVEVEKYGSKLELRVKGETGASAPTFGEQSVSTKHHWLKQFLRRSSVGNLPVVQGANDLDRKRVLKHGQPSPITAGPSFERLQNALGRVPTLGDHLPVPPHRWTDVWIRHLHRLGRISVSFAGLDQSATTSPTSVFAPWPADLCREGQKQSSLLQVYGTGRRRDGPERKSGRSRRDSPAPATVRSTAMVPRVTSPEHLVAWKRITLGGHRIRRHRQRSTDGEAYTYPAEPASSVCHPTLVACQCCSAGRSRLQGVQRRPWGALCLSS